VGIVGLLQKHILIKEPPKHNTLTIYQQLPVKTLVNSKDQLLEVLVLAGYLIPNILIELVEY